MYPVNVLQMAKMKYVITRIEALFIIVKDGRDFLGGPVVKTLGFHCRGHGFSPWLGN